MTLGRSHTTGMKSKVHPTYKTQYRVANLPAYNQTLVRRGDVTFVGVLGSDRCLDAPPERPAGWARRYSDLAIETARCFRHQVLVKRA